jgi:hypothetical protein
MTFDKVKGRFSAAAIGAGAAVLFSGAPALAATATVGDLARACTGDADTCGAVFQIDGNEVGRVGFSVDPKTGAFTVGSQTFQSQGATWTLNSASGNVDPFVLFSFGATNTSLLPKTYSAAFSLPISLTGEVDASARVSYSLTAGSNPAAIGATLFPTSGTGKVVDSQDIRFSPFDSKDKGVDVGDVFSVAEGTTGSSPIFAATNSLVLTGSPYTLMSVIVAFGLTPDSAAGLSGEVVQIPIPEPGTWALMLVGLVGLGAIARRAAASQGG